MLGEKARDCFGMVLGGIAVAALLRPFANTPFVDDWAYAWSVEELLRNGDLKIGDYSVNYNVCQILWGTLFCLPGGFSFSALRVSTWTLALSSLCGLYLLLRELDVPRRLALLGTVTWAVYPIFFILSFTFMSDVPYVVCLIWVSYTMVRAVREKSDLWLAISIFLACVAMGLRTVAGVIPIAMGIVLVLHSGAWGWQRGRGLWPVVPLLLLLCLVWWCQGNIMYSADMKDTDNSKESRLEDLTYVLPNFPSYVVGTIGFVAGAVGIALLPLAAAVASRRILIRSVLVLGLLVLVLAGGQRIWNPGYCMPFQGDQTWTLPELGATESLVPGYAEGVTKPWQPWLGMVLGCISFAIIVATLWRPLAIGEAFLVWQFIGHFLLMVILNLDYDRYALVLIPPAIVLFLAAKPSLRPTIACTLIGLMGALAFVGVRDHLHYSGALWEAVRELKERGVPEDEIDGGYVVNGWLQFAHPDKAHRDEDGKIMIPSLNSSEEELSYQIANSVRDGWKPLRRIPYHRWLGHSGDIYILERQQAFTSHDPLP
jgi:hypothetical protein